MIILGDGWPWLRDSHCSSTILLVDGTIHGDSCVTPIVITAHKRSFGRVLFSHESVCPEGGLPSQNAMGQADTPPPPPYGQPAGGTHLSIIHTCLSTCNEYSGPYVTNLGTNLYKLALKVASYS